MKYDIYVQQLKKICINHFVVITNALITFFSQGEWMQLVDFLLSLEGRFQLMTGWRFIAQSLLLSSFHRLDMTLIIRLKRM